MASFAKQRLAEIFQNTLAAEPEVLLGLGRLIEANVNELHVVKLEKPSGVSNFRATDLSGAIEELYKATRLEFAERYIQFELVERSSKKVQDAVVEVVKSIYLKPKDLGSALGNLQDIEGQFAPAVGDLTDAFDLLVSMGLELLQSLKLTQPKFRTFTPQDEPCGFAPDRDISLSPDWERLTDSLTQYTRSVLTISRYANAAVVFAFNSERNALERFTNLVKGNVWYLENQPHCEWDLTKEAVVDQAEKVLIEAALVYQISRLHTSTYLDNIPEGLRLIKVLPWISVGFRETKPDLQRLFYWAELASRKIQAIIDKELDEIVITQALSAMNFAGRGPSRLSVSASNVEFNSSGFQAQAASFEQTGFIQQTGFTQGGFQQTGFIQQTGFVEQAGLVEQTDISIKQTGFIQEESIEEKPAEIAEVNASESSSSASE